jgi:hypothetical protein
VTVTTGLTVLVSKKNRQRNGQKKKVQKDKHRSTKRQLRVLPTLTDPIGVCLFSSKSDDFGLVLESTNVSSVNYGHHVRFFFFNSRFDI